MLFKIYQKVINLISQQKSIQSIKLIKNGVVNNTDDIRLICLLRNEKNKLPAFLEHYRNLGVSTFYILDNDSDDGSFEYLEEQKDVCLLYTKDSYKNNLWWRKYLLKKFGLNKWCITVDSDEFLIYENMESVSLKELIQCVNSSGANYVKALWLDFYPDTDISKKEYKFGESPFSTHKYFDKTARQKSVAERYFGWRSEFDKAPIVYYTQDKIIDAGFHRITGNAKAYHHIACVAHFPYIDDFVAKVERESQREVYFNKGAKYKTFNDVIMTNKKIVNFYTENSIEFKDSSTFKALNFYQDK